MAKKLGGRDHREEPSDGEASDDRSRYRDRVFAAPRPVPRQPPPAAQAASDVLAQSRPASTTGAPPIAAGGGGAETQLSFRPPLSRPPRPLPGAQRGLADQGGELAGA